MQRHKQCAFNLYAAAMFRHALAPMAELFEGPECAAEYRRLGDTLLASTVGQFWSHDDGLFVDNLPWLAEERRPPRVIVRWRQPSCLTNAPMDASKQRSKNWPTVQTGWDSLIRAMRVGGCGPWQRRDASTSFCRIYGRVGQPCVRSWRTTLCRKAGRCSPTRAPSGVTVPWSRFTLWRKTLPGFGPRHRALGNARSARSWVTCASWMWSSIHRMVPYAWLPRMTKAGRLQLAIPQGVEAELVLPADVAPSITLPDRSTEKSRALKRFLLKTAPRTTCC